MDKRQIAYIYDKEQMDKVLHSEVAIGDCDSKSLERLALRRKTNRHCFRLRMTFWREDRQKEIYHLAVCYLHPVDDTWRYETKSNGYHLDLLLSTKLCEQRPTEIGLLECFKEVPEKTQMRFLKFIKQTLSYVP